MVVVCEKERALRLNIHTTTLSPTSCTYIRYSQISIPSDTCNTRRRGVGWRVDVNLEPIQFSCPDQMQRLARSLPVLKRWLGPATWRNSLLLFLFSTFAPSPPSTSLPLIGGDYYRYEVAHTGDDDSIRSTEQEISEVLTESRR